MTFEKGDDRAGAPENNSNAVKHNLYADDDKLIERLDDGEKELFWALVKDLFDRIEGKVGPYERETVKQLAVDTIKRRKFNEHDGAFNPDDEAVHKMYSKVRRDNIKEMKELGISTKSPEAKEAEAKSDWFDKVAEAQDDE